MRLDAITVALRMRTPWEATDLGIALVRAHAGRVWSAWFLSTLPAFVLFNAFALALDAPWLGALLMWWAKPVFDRVPLFVISRAVFGATPSLRDTLVAQRRWGWRAMLAWLTWRRFHPGRAMLLPVDLLEGVRGAQRKDRVYVLSRAHASPNALLMLIGANMETVFVWSALLLVLMFVPIEFFQPSVRAMWDTLFDHPPAWAQVLGNGVYWGAMSIVEPFYVGAGFGLYLNRRMQLEAWDVELAFRRLAARLTPAPFAAAALLLLSAVAFDAGHARAATAPQPAASSLPDGWQRLPQAKDERSAPSPDVREGDFDARDDDGDDDENAPKKKFAGAAEPAGDAATPARAKPADAKTAEAKPADAKSAETSDPAKPKPTRDNGVVCRITDAPKDRGTPLDKLFAKGFRKDGADFEAAVKKAYAEADLDPKIKQYVWKARHPENADRDEKEPGWARGLGGAFGFVAEYGLWILIGVALLVIVLNHRRWLSWLSDRAGAAPPPMPTALGALPTAPEPLPDDVPAAVRALLAQGRVRAGLALLYRAAVARLVERLGAPLPPGATEADCLRRARSLADARYAGLFARIVRCWQVAAYAQRPPPAGEIEALLGEWSADGVTA